MFTRQKSNDSSKQLSRRDFFQVVGKLAGGGLLSHFSLIGLGRDKIDFEKIQDNRTICKIANLNVCDYEYNCTSVNAHSCHTRFTCNGTFTCTPNSSNQCTSSQFKE